MNYLRQILLLTFIIHILSQTEVKSQSADDLYRKSINYFNLKQYTQALYTINKAMEGDSLHADYYLQRARIQFELGNYDEAIRDCYSILKIKPNQPEVYLLRGHVCMVTESYGGALLFYGKAIKFTDKNNLLFEAFFNRGKAYMELKKYYDAQSDFLSAYEIDSESPELLVALASSYFYMGRTDEALKNLNRAIGIDNENSEARYLIGKIAEKQGDYPLAIDSYEKYLELEPMDADVYNRLADVLYKNNDPTHAISALGKSIELVPANPESYKILGLIYISLKEKEKGCNSLFRAMQLGYLEKYGYDLLDTYLEQCEPEE
ncbi:MAG: tetratricopeptide repeat protein [Bacteroidales bacterium]|nr:tetratricopeptide repeat protein [Bacteroidales bacterium]